MARPSKKKERTSRTFFSIMSFITENDIKALEPVKTFYRLFERTEMTRLIVDKCVQCHVNRTFQGSNLSISRDIKNSLKAYIYDDFRKKGY